MEKIDFDSEGSEGPRLHVPVGRKRRKESESARVLVPSRRLNTLLQSPTACAAEARGAGGKG